MAPGCGRGKQQSGLEDECGFYVPVGTVTLLVLGLLTLRLAPYGVLCLTLACECVAQSSVFSVLSPRCLENFRIWGGERKEGSVLRVLRY